MNTREELSQVAESVCQAEGAELYWLDYRQGGNRVIVKVFIEKEGGVTVEDCARVSRALEPRFDEQIHYRYLLEVSSPGIERQLHTEDHFRRALGKLIRVKMDRPIDGRLVIEGRLVSLHPQLVLEADFGPVRISWSDLAQAHILSPPCD